MGTNKLEGIKILEFLKIPTVKRLNLHEIITGDKPIEEGLSIRVSPKRWSSATHQNVWLPSIHGCTNRDRIREFVKENSNRYDVFAHKTVNPDVIGSVSKFEEELVLETFADFGQRKLEKVANRMTVPVEGGRILVNKLQLKENDEGDFENFRKVLMHLKKMPFTVYDAEYVIEDGKVVFTDLTIPESREYKDFKDIFMQER